LFVAFFGQFRGPVPHLASRVALIGQQRSDMRLTDGARNVPNQSDTVRACFKDKAEEAPAKWKARTCQLLALFITTKRAGPGEALNTELQRCL
jgi:hypothetical protein